MGITRAQQVRQMLEDGGMLVKPRADGKRPGYYGPDAGHENDPGTNSGNTGGNNDNKGQGRDTDFQQRGMSKKDYNTAVNRGDIGQNFSARPNFFKNLQNKSQTLSLKNLYDIKTGAREILLVFKWLIYIQMQR